ncbi:hypothetical protein [Halochromatium glycolicum]|uniref:hypothetical protein n=1 Tax=Halochromatium glycolicum TaxID=85075 RepID=UPI001909B556|nr:hypothetical protein [Halochromatium glycolicum]
MGEVVLEWHRGFTARGVERLQVVEILDGDDLEAILLEVFEPLDNLFGQLLVFDVECDVVHGDQR